MTITTLADPVRCLQTVLPDHECSVREVVQGFTFRMLAIVLGQVCRCVVPCTALHHKLKLRYHGNADATPITFSPQAGGLTRAGQALSSPLLAMCCGMALASTGVLPQDCPAYDAVWQVGTRERAARFVCVSVCASSCVCFCVCAPLLLVVPGSITLSAMVQPRPFQRRTSLALPF
jgi:hypothetical protein